MDAVFIDRDGVINKNLTGDYIKNWKDFEFLPRSLESLTLLKNNNITVIVVSNQSGVAKGLMTEKELDEVNKKFLEIVNDNGGKIDAVYYCTHNSDGTCECRKPKPGLLLKAAKDFGIDLKKSYMIGDYISDIEAGASAGSKTILVRTGRGKETISYRDEWDVAPDYIVSDLLEAAEIIIKSKNKKQNKKPKEL